MRRLVFSKIVNTSIKFRTSPSGPDNNRLYHGLYDAPWGQRQCSFVPEKGIGSITLSHRFAAVSKKRSLWKQSYILKASLDKI